MIPLHHFMASRKKVFLTFVVSFVSFSLKENEK